MKSKGSPEFWASYYDLPTEIRRHARDAYRLWLADPHLPGLRFKRISQLLPYYSVRITRDYRVVGELVDDTIIWVFIGNHAAYERFLAMLN